MNKKNMYNRKNIIIIILIICIILFSGYILLNKNDKKVVVDNQKTTELEEEINNLKSKISLLESDKESLNNEIKEYKNQIESLETNISNLEKSYNDSLKTNNELSLEKETLNNSIKTLQEEKAKLNSQVNELQEKITVLNSNIEELNNLINTLKTDLSEEKDTFTVFYSVNNKVIYQERVKKGQNVKNVPSSPIENTTVTWSSDGKNIQNDTVIHGIVYCTLYFYSATDENEIEYATISTSSYQVPYNSVIEITSDTIKLDGEVIVTSTFNEDSTGVIDSYTGWGIYNEDGELDVMTSGIYKITKSEYLYAYYGGCVLKGTKIAMANGTTKNVEDLVSGEKILSYDFFTGEMVEKEVLGILKTTSQSSNVISVNLSNGSTLKIVDLEYVFDVEDKKYFLVNPQTYEQLVGKHLIVNNNGNRQTAEVVSVSLNKEATEHYTLFVEDSSNYIAEGIVTRTFTYWLNDYFTFTDDLKIDQDQLNKDILRYGVYTYDEVKDYVSYEIFTKMNLKYAKFVEGKGIASHEYVLESLSMLEYEIIESNKRFNK